VIQPSEFGLNCLVAGRHGGWLNALELTFLQRRNLMVAQSSTMTLEVEDFTGQVRRRSSGIPRAATVSDLVDSFRSEMALPDQDAQGRPVQYGLMSSSSGEMLNATDQLGDVLADEEVVTLTKSVTAGGAA
jgi:hypothetical protein